MNLLQKLFKITLTRLHKYTRIFDAIQDSVIFNKPTLRMRDQNSCFKNFQPLKKGDVT